MENKCTEAVMESTGSYWKPVFNILEGSLKIILANPEQVKALRGKKTDPNDSRWLASLLRARIGARQLHPRRGTFGNSGI
jgi:transposase